MKASESNSNYPSRLREMTNFTIREIKKMCSSGETRESGGEGERKAQEYVAESMTKVADGVETQQIEVRPEAYTGAALVCAVMTVVSALGLILFTGLNLLGGSIIISIVLLVISLAALLLISGEILMCAGIASPLFPKKQSCNVVCTRKPSGEVKRRIVFCGHTDASYEYRYAAMSGIGLHTAIIKAGAVSAALNAVLNIISLFDLPRAADIAVAVIAAVSIIPAAACAAAFNKKRVIPGANSLTGVFSSMAVIRYMAANDVRFENTEVAAVSLACGEAGAEGAKAFAKMRAEADVPTMLVAVENLHDFDDLGAVIKASSKTLDADAAELIARAGKNAGLELSLKRISGVSDAIPAAKGVKRTALTAEGKKPDKYYHTEADKSDALVPKTIEAGINVLLETAFLFDEKGTI